MNKIKVYLGYEDEFVTEKNKYQVNFTTSKIGGKPDWPFLETDPKNPNCPLCGFQQLLIVQLYAPLEKSPYHRTLYIFGCINPNCWSHTESWTCLRSQLIDESYKIESTETTSTAGITATEWVRDADDWGDDDKNDNVNEENGNFEGGDEDEEESCSMEDSLRVGLEELYVDNKNANNGEAQGGAVGRLHSPTATAEIEGEESEVVSIDTPTAPQHNLVALLQEVPPVPFHSPKLEFNSIFLSIDEEDIRSPNIPEHIRDLLNEYQLQNGELLTPTGGGDEGEGEKYEQSAPIHGDRMFHYFVSRIKMNPGQVLRYSVGNPLLVSPLTELPGKCRYCDGEMRFEFQVLPTLIPKLKLKDFGTSGHFEFGNILVFTCRDSCWGNGESTRQEVIILQSERY